METPGKWVFPFMNQELELFKLDEMREIAN
jgi:hypothetical protein